MATTQIEESDLARLREDAGRVTTLESERDTAIKERDEAQAERDSLKESVAKQDAEKVVAKLIGESTEAAKVTLDELQEAGLASKAVLGEDGKVDEAKTKEAIDTAVAKIAESNGAGKPRGFGGQIPSGGDTPTVEAAEAALDSIAGDVFGTPVKEA